MQKSHDSFWASAHGKKRMFMQGFTLIVIVQAVIVGLLLYSLTSKLDVTIHDPITGQDTKQKVTTEMMMTYVACYLDSDENSPIRVTVDKELLPYSFKNKELPPVYYRVLIDAVTASTFKTVLSEFKHHLKQSFFLYLLLIPYFMYFARQGNKNVSGEFVRGAKLTQLNKFTQTVNSTAGPLSIKVGELKIPYDVEPKHTLILGSPGAGKSVLINQLARQINDRTKIHKRSDRIIWYDPKGEFLAKQFQDGDVIFNVFDARSISWNIFNEIEVQPDFDVLARSLFTCPDEKNKFFYSGAAAVFKTGLIYLKAANQTKNSDIWAFFSQSADGIIKAFKALPIDYHGAIKFIDSGDSGPAASVLAVLQDHLAFIEYLTGFDTTDTSFSFRNFIRSNETSNLFIVNANQNFEKIFAPLMTLAVDIMTREALSLSDNAERRLFFVLDELGTLGKMESLLNLLTVGRSKGLCMICASQDLGRIEDKYGANNLTTFFNNFATLFAFRVAGKTQKVLSEAIGQREVKKTTTNVQAEKASQTLNEQDKLEFVILPSEFGELKPFNAIVSISGYGTTKLEIPKIFYPERFQAYAPREFKPILTTLESKSQSEQPETPEVETQKTSLKKFNI